MKDVLTHPEKEAWLAAIREELQNLFPHDIWTIELVPNGKRVRGARWVFIEKRTPEEKLIKLTRYVAKGFAQIAGVECIDTFAPTAAFVSLDCFSPWQPSVTGLYTRLTLRCSLPSLP